MDDPRRAIVEVMARLGRETQLHIDERHRHFQITDIVILGISLLLIIVAAFNVYFVWVLSTDMDGIVNNMDSMRQHLVKVDDDMSVIAETVEKYDEHIAYMHVISSNVGDLASSMPVIRTSMDSMTYNMQTIDSEMSGMNQAISNIGQNIHLMTQGMAGMKHNVRQFSGPMGALNPVFP